MDSAPLLHICGDREKDPVFFYLSWGDITFGRPYFYAHKVVHKITHGRIDMDYELFLGGINMDEEKRHFITMENREKLTITEVEDVESFDKEKVVVYTSMGTMTVSGSGFRIHKLNVEDGQLVIDGEIDEIKYSQSREPAGQGGFFSRLFQ